MAGVGVGTGSVVGGVVAGAGVTRIGRRTDVPVVLPVMATVT